LVQGVNIPSKSNDKLATEATHPWR
jgi:hypothetical protein